MKLRLLDHYRGEENRAIYDAESMKIFICKEKDINYVFQNYTWDNKNETKRPKIIEGMGIKVIANMANYRNLQFQYCFAHQGDYGRKLS